MNVYDATQVALADVDIEKAEAFIALCEAREAVTKAEARWAAAVIAQAAAYAAE